MPKPSIYTVGGTVQAGGGIYIKRKADDELLDLCRQGELAFILSSRQVGKSSLMTQTAEQLGKENIQSATVDLSSIGTKLTQDEWYLGILNVIATDLNLETNIFTWWTQYSGLGPAQRFFNFLRDVMLKEVKQSIVLFFDEIDTTLSIPFADDFFTSVRATYNARSTAPDFKRLSFVLVGVATPSELISDSKRTPFNIGHRVELNDFTLEEAMPLAQGFEENAVQVLAWILEWSGGHPYLTQRICQHLSKNDGAIDKQTVEVAAEDLFFGEHGKQDNNLQFVRDMLSKRSPDVTKVLLTYKAIRSGKKVTDDERSITKAHLKLSGLVRSQQGILRARNEIYNRVFNLHWIQENTPKNWIKITAVTFAVLTFSLLFILIYDFVVGSLSSQYAGDFYRAQSASGKLEYLAKIFELQGILSNSDYDYLARELFYSLDMEYQTSMFSDPLPVSKQKDSSTVIRGLYVTMANVEGGQDSSDLLRLMMKALNNVNASDNLRNEINLWLDARSAATSQEAFEKYTEAIQLNPDNPATRYERAKVEIQLGEYELTLLDLEAIIGLAQNLSAEGSEGENLSPTNLPVNTSTILTPVLTVAPTIPTVPAEGNTGTEGRGTDHNQDAPVVRDPYRSSFYSFATIRSAVDLLIQRNKLNPDFRNSLVLAKGEPDRYSNLNNGLLPSEETLTAISISTPTEAIIPTSIGDILLEDDFSSSQWGTGTDSDSSIEYANNSLQMIVFTKNYFVWSTPNSENYQNVRMEVTVLNNGTDSATAFGLICNQQDPANASFYYFAMTPAGEYTIARAESGQSDVFLTNNDQWSFSDLISKDASSYRVGADCGDGTLTLHVDGKQIDSVSDSSYTSGGVAVFTWSGEDATSTNVSFDDFLMKALP